MDWDKIDGAFEAIERLRLSDFILPYRELPEGATAALDVLIDAFAKADSAERQRIAQRVEASFAFVFPRYSRHAAVQSVRRNEPELLERGLRALAIENAKVDWRDMLPELALIYNSARRVNVNPADLFHNAAEIACPDFRKLLEAFLNRDESARTIESFYYEEHGEGTSFNYVYVEPPPRIPAGKGWKIRAFLRRLRLASR